MLVMGFGELWRATFSKAEEACDLPAGMIRGQKTWFVEANAAKILMKARNNDEDLEAAESRSSDYSTMPMKREATKYRPAGSLPIEDDDDEEEEQKSGFLDSLKTCVASVRWPGSDHLSPRQHSHGLYLRVLLLTLARRAYDLASGRLQASETHHMR